MNEPRTPKRKRHSARDWSRRIESWERSGLSAAEFIEREGSGLNERTLVWWRSELKRRARGERPRNLSGSRGSSRSTPPIELARVAVTSATETATPVRVGADPIEVVLATGVVVRVPTTTSASRAAELVAAIAQVTSPMTVARR